MEFDEHEEQEGEIGMNNSGLARKISGGGGGVGGTAVSAGGTTPAMTTPTVAYRYRECLKNHAVGIGGNAVDGCGEFMAAGGDGTLESLICAACSCHRNFHRKEAEGGGGGEGFHHHHHLQPPYPQPQHHHLATAYSFRSPHPTGYLHVTPQQPARPLALPSNSREEEDMSNPSSSGGVGGGGDGSKKRFRTRFTPEQKEKMLGFAERLGWRIQKQDEALVQQFCAETNVRRHVLKVWMHNNKHTLGKKP